jgi:excisionase family DNA binding protein
MVSFPISVNNMLGSEEKDSAKELNVKAELPPRTMLRPSEVASFLRVSERTVYRWFELGLIEGVRINKSLRITRGSILTLLQRSGAER